MTNKEFANKVDWEGGLWEALLGYGLKAAHLDDKEGELFLALTDLEKIIHSEEFIRALGRVEDALPEEGDEE